MIEYEYEYKIDLSKPTKNLRQYSKGVFDKFIGKSFPTYLTDDTYNSYNEKRDYVGETKITEVTKDEIKVIFTADDTSPITTILNKSVKDNSVSIVPCGIGTMNSKNEIINDYELHYFNYVINPAMTVTIIKRTEQRKKMTNKEYQENNCKECEYRKWFQTDTSWGFNGCTCPPYKGKWITEIDKCPKRSNNDIK